MDKVKIFIVDDSQETRNLVKRYIEFNDNFEVVGEAGSGKETLDKLRMINPDVILMDINMPNLDGVTATERIIAENPHIKILVLTVSEDSQDLVKAIKAGARGYLLKDTDKSALIKAIEAIYKGESIINPAMAADLLDEFRYMSKKSERKPHPLATKLTDREQEVLKLMAEGLDNKEIAKKLFVSESTIKNHVSNILSKLQLENRIQAAVFAAHQGFINPKE